MESLAPLSDRRNPFPTNGAQIPDLRQMALRMTPEQAERGRKLGCIRARQAKLIQKIRALIVQLNRACQDLQDLQDPASPAVVWTLQDLQDPANPVTGSAGSSRTFAPGVLGMGISSS